MNPKKMALGLSHRCFVGPSFFYFNFRLGFEFVIK
jgi:hypothetical protein